MTSSNTGSAAVADWNATDHAFEETRWVHQIVEAKAKETPDAVALVFQGERLTYRELDTDANRLANVLRERGVGRGSIIAVCMERSFELLVGLLAVLKAGAAYAPLDPTHPPARLRLLVDDLATPLVLTQPGTAGPFGGKALHVDRAALRSASTATPEVTIGDDDLAYIIYTSGSTGTPKGVMSTHVGMRNRLLWGQAYYPIHPTDAVLQKTPYTFDVSVWELFWPLIIGARLVIAKPEGHKDPHYVAQIIRDEKVTISHFVPSMLALFLESYATGSTPSLRGVVCSGEALPRALQDRFFEKVGPHCALLNYYGPTEASIEVSYWPCKPNDPPGEVPIGWPVFNTQLWVVDAEFAPCPVGVAGELMIAGIGVARGYLKRPELSAEKFVPDPFAKRPGARMYRTGDLARWRPDGAIEYLGRIDHQVKIRGLRVELGEIETALAACTGVVAAAVLARDLANGDKQLVGYVVAKDGATLDEGALARQLGETLPAYMVPSVFVTMPSFPLTSSGKVDRKALPPPPAQRADAREGAVPAGDPLESLVARVFGDVLGLSSVSIDETFMALGGSSLTTVRVLARLGAELRLALPFTALFEFPTARRLAAELRRRGASTADGGAAPTATGIARLRSRADWLPLAYDNFPFWFVEQLMPGINIVAFTLRPPKGRRLSLTTLQRAYDAVISRNEVLRTTYGLVKGNVMQRIAPAGSSQPLPHTDLRGKSAAERDEALRKIHDTVVNDRFDLKRGPLLRMHAVSTDDEDFVIACSHHVAWDAHSSTMMGHELSVFYEAYDHGAAITLPPVRVQYADYCAHQLEQLPPGSAPAAVDYWEQKLADIRPLPLPVDRPRKAKVSAKAGRIEWTLDRPVTAKLHELARENGTTIFVVVAAAIAHVLGRTCGSPDVVLGTTVSTRDRPELDRLLGCFVNTLPLRVDVGTDSAAELVRRMRETTAEALSHNVPFDLIVKRVRRPSEVGRAVIYDVLLAGQSDAAQSTSDLFQVERLEAVSTSIDRDLQFQVEQLADPIFGWLQYRLELYDAGTVQRIAKDLVATLEALAEGRLPPR